MVQVSQNMLTKFFITKFLFIIIPKPWFLKVPPKIQPLVPQWLDFWLPKHTKEISCHGDCITSFGISWCTAVLHRANVHPVDIMLKRRRKNKNNKKSRPTDPSLEGVCYLNQSFFLFLLCKCICTYGHDYELQSLCCPPSPCSIGGHAVGCLRSLGKARVREAVVRSHTPQPTKGHGWESGSHKVRLCSSWLLISVF